MKNKLLVIFYIIFYFYYGLNAQINVDSINVVYDNKHKPDSTIFNAINSFCENNAYNSPDTVIALSNYHYDLAKAKGLKVEMMNALDNKVVVHYIQSKLEDALAGMKQSLEIAEQLNDDIQVAKKHNNIGAVYVAQSNYKEAIRYFSKSLTVFKNIKTEENEAGSLTNIGVIYTYLDDYEMATEYLNQALDIYKRLGFEDKIGNVWLTLGDINLQKEQFHEAIEHGHKSIRSFQNQNNRFNLNQCYSLISESYHNLGVIDSALHYINKSFSINKEFKNELGIIKNKTAIAELIYKSNIKESTKLAEEVAELIELNPELETQKRINYLLYNCYKKQGNYPLALAAHEKYVTYNDSLFIIKNKSAITREAIKSEFEMELLEAKLNNENEKSQLKIQFLKRLFAFGLLSLGLISLIIYFFRKRMLSQRNQKETLLAQIKQLKENNQNTSANLYNNQFELNRGKIEEFINKKLNETDWKVLNILLEDPVISNKEIAQKVFLTTDGISSSLKRMYQTFDIKHSKYKKISLLMKSIKISNKITQNVD